ncbi:hypothetical protein Tco_1365292, partial [Tanacetum coccineum]
MDARQKCSNKEAELYSLMLGVYPASCQGMEVNKDVPGSITAILEEFEDVFALPTEL